MTIHQTIQQIKTKGFTPEVKSKFSKQELLAVQRILEEIEETGKSDTLEALWQSDFERKPVSIDEFLEDDYYLGKVGRDVYPKWRGDLRKVLDPYAPKIEWIIEGSIGSGKSYCAVLALLYKIYYLTCLIDPQKFFGLGSKTPIVFGFFNIFKYLAQATSYQYLTTWLRDMSPYFRSLRLDVGKPGKRESDKAVLNLPKGITIALGSNAIHALGQNLLAGMLDEADFGKEKSITSTEKSQIADLYHQVRTRMDSRFMQRGGSNPGLLCLVSSARETEQFMAKHIAAKRDDINTHVSSYALYEIKEDKYEGSDRFRVVVGDKLHKSYIAEDEDENEIREGATVLEVPVEFLGAYRYDLDSSIRNISGVRTYGKKLFLPRRDVLLECMEACTPRKHPFTREEVSLSIDDDTAIEDYLVRDELLELFDKSNKLYRPRFFPYADRFVHVDLAKNRDCAGIAMGCISKQVEIERYTPEGLKVRARDYQFFVDLMLRIRAGKGSEIDFAKIRRFIFFLMLTGNFKIKWVGYDSYQSTDSIQIFKKEKVQSKEFSVDKKPGPYRALRSVVMERRLDTYYYEPFYEEITLLEDHSGEVPKRKPEIDHPVNGSKDVSDAVTGFVSGALISKGAQISGTDAEIIAKRAKKYIELTKEKPDIRDPKTHVKSVMSGYIKQNPLEKLFED